MAANLGQSVDSGEIATALLVHWPDAHSDAYRDLRRAASWGLALGRFWKIDDFFSDGERPFHHYRGRADEGSGDWLRRVVAAERPNPLSSVATAYRQQLQNEAAGTIEAMTALVSSTAPAESTDVPETVAGDPQARLLAAGQSLCRALGGQPAAPLLTDQSAADSPVPRRLLINPHPISLRTDVPLTGGPGPTAANLQNQLFSWNQTATGHCVATVDVAGGGFLSLDGSHAAPKTGWFKRKRKLASGSGLSNEFLEIEISPTSGGIHGVYSGSQRGNRYSSRLVASGVIGVSSASDAMVARQVEVVHADAALGEIRASGQLLGGDGQLLADWIVTYRLQRGSRWLQIETTLRPTPQLQLDDNPWRSHVAWRSAFSSESSTLSLPLRDKLYRITHSKQFDSPAGVLVDEVDRTTLIHTAGYPAHQPSGNRFLDSLILVRGEQQLTSTLAVGFDVPSPLVALRAQGLPPLSLAVDRCPTAATGWLLHCGTPDILVTDLRIDSTGPLVLSMLVIGTSSESRKAKLRFCRNVTDAQRQTDNPHQPQQAVTFTADGVDLPLAGYESVRLHVTFE